MDDYRDLVAASLTLACAGIMLVAGQLYLEHRATHSPGHQVVSPLQPQRSPALISRAPSPGANTAGPRQEAEKNRAG